MSTEPRNLTKVWNLKKYTILPAIARKICSGTAKLACASLNIIEYRFLGKNRLKRLKSPLPTFSPTTETATPSPLITYGVVHFYNCHKAGCKQGACDLCGVGGACCSATYIDKNSPCSDEQQKAVEDYSRNTCHEQHYCVYDVGT